MRIRSWPTGRLRGRARCFECVRTLRSSFRVCGDHMSIDVGTISRYVIVSFRCLISANLCCAFHMNKFASEISPTSRCSCQSHLSSPSIPFTSSSTTMHQPERPESQFAQRAMSKTSTSTSNSTSTSTPRWTSAPHRTRSTHPNQPCVLIRVVR